MKNTFPWMRGALWAAAGLLAVVAGCETSSTPDIGDLDSYFAENPYISDPRKPGTARDMTITPSTAAAQFIGQKILFTARGGQPPYKWAAPGCGVGCLIAGAGDHQAIFSVQSLVACSIVASDQNGAAAIAYITLGGSTNTPTPVSVLTASASPTTLAVDGSKSVVTAAGGVPPYAWSVADVALGNVDSSSGTSVIYTRLHHGDNAVKVRDSAGNVAGIVIQQP